MTTSPRPPRSDQRRRRRLIGLGTLAALVLVAVVVLAARGGDDRREMALHELVAALEAGEVSEATIVDRSDKVTGTLADGEEFEASFPQLYASELTERLLEAGVPIEVEGGGMPTWERLLLELVPILLLVAVFVGVLSLMPGGSKALGLGRVKARRASSDQPVVTFADVAGADEAVEELAEIRDFLADPQRFSSMGAYVPKGVLLYGPPGTGKTLLARAVAGEAGVPFFHLSGSDFVEMFVGVGASRVRDLFQQAKAEAPAIVFVDEIDAVGRHRGSGTGGGHDEREQTLNQLLVEMDGFEVGSGVILIAATNRPDILDPALLRPGRFDRQIAVDRPGLEGREAILRVHMAGKPTAADVDLRRIARRTAGFSGADLANLVNEGILMAVRRGADAVARVDLDAAAERVMAGPERRSRIISEEEKRIIAYHEGGHALVGHVLPGTHPVHKVSIVARGQALGWTMALPIEDRHLERRSALTDELAMMLAGRAAELQVFGEATTGAANDIERASEIARAMVTRYGMSERVGPVQVAGPHAAGATASDAPSDAMAALVDDEVRIILEAAHQRASDVVATHRATLDELVARLVAEEVIEEEGLEELLGHLPTWPGPHAADPDLRPEVGGSAADPTNGSTR